MQTIPGRIKASFIYEGKAHSGYIINSLDIEPHFYWFLLYNVELVEKFGDCIAFTKNGDSLIPVHNYPNHRGFVEAVRQCVQQHM
jgi:hypothetical protein